MTTTETLVQVAAEAVIGFFLERVLQVAKPPTTDTDWLRSRGAKVAMRRALLSALEDSLEHAPHFKLRAFDAAFLDQDEVTKIIAGLLLPTQIGTPEQVVVELVAAWRRQFREGYDKLDDGFEAFVAGYVDNLVRHLRSFPQFRSLLDSCTLEEIRESLSIAASNPPQATAADQAEIQASLQRIEALLLTLQPPVTAVAPERTVRKLQIPGIRPLNLGEIGFLGQSPTVVTDRGIATVYVGSGDGVIHAVHPDAGRVYWSQPLPNGYRMPQAFAVWRDFLLVAPQSDDLLAPDKALLMLERESGAIEWEIPLPTRQTGAPAVRGDHAFVAGSDGVLYAVDLVRGAVDWQLPLRDNMAISPQAPLVVGDCLILPATDHHLRCVDLSTQTLLWTVSAQGAGAYFTPAPIVHGATVYAANWNGAVYALDVATGDERWRYDTGRTVDHAPVYADGLVIVGSYSHHVYALDAATGALRWQSEDLRRRIYSRPLALGAGEEGVVYAAQYRKQLHALRLTDGTPLWDEPLTLADRARGDFVLCDGLLVVPGGQGLLQSVRVAPRAADQLSVDELRAAGEWPMAAARLVQAGELAAAADLYAEHALFYRAGQLYEEAGAMAQAAAVYARDEGQPSSWRKAAALYLEHDDPAAAAALLECTEEWVDAAQAWEQAGVPAKAAAIYAEQLREPHKAAQLFREAAMPLAAAEQLAGAGEYAAAVDVLVEAGAKAHAGKIRAYRRALLAQGDRQALSDLLAEAVNHEERAEIYMSLNEWTKAAEVLAEAGDWELAVELLIDQDRIDPAINLLERRAEHAAQTKLAGLLCKQLRWREALDLYRVLGDRLAQATCLEKLDRLQDAARLLEDLAQDGEAPRLDDAAEQAVGELFDQAARLYRRAYAQDAFARCKAKANYYQRRPWLALAMIPPRTITVERASTLTVLVTNQSRGIAHDVMLELIDNDNTMRFSDYRPIAGIGEMARQESTFQLWASVSGDITVRVRLAWTERVDGAERRKWIELPTPWIITVSEPGATDRQTPVNYYVGGDLIMDSEVIQGNQYRDHAQHGDRVEINRGAAGPEASVSLGLPCPNPECGVNNPIMAAFCDACGTDLRSR